MSVKKKILVIKQTSLGDVLHASGHIRSIKQAYPHSELYLMTATTSVDIYRHSPWVDHTILIDRDSVKKQGYRKPVWAIKYMFRVLSEVREHQFDLAFDLQGLAKSVFFLYFAHAKRKFVKGSWWGIKGFRDKRCHALREMDKVLEVAGVEINDTSMEFNAGLMERQKIDALLSKINPGKRPFVIFSPFSRWLTKDWPLSNYVILAKSVSEKALIVFTGAPNRKADIDQALLMKGGHDVVNLAGVLNLVEFAELAGRASCMVTGDSFPMHVAGAKKTPVVALFGPTDETKVGPLGEHDTVIRAPNCDRCDRRSCPKQCLNNLKGDSVLQALNQLLEE